MPNCSVCGVQHLKPDRRRINVKTGEEYVVEGNLYYVRNKYNELIPVCEECKEK